MSKHRGFCITINNYDENCVKSVNDFIEKNCDYGCFGREIAPTSGTPHLQCYMHFTNPRAFGPLKKEFPTAHIEGAKGSALDNKNYCSKEGNFIEFGKIPIKGERTDIIKITTLIREGKSEKEICSNDDDAERYTRHLKNYRELKHIFVDEKRCWPMDVRVYWGVPGSGKTRAVYEEFSSIYEKMSGKWWDGYAGEECVLIDDFDPGDCYGTDFAFFLKLMDRYPLRIEWKGGSGHFSSKVIIFTSNFNPSEWFQLKENRSAFFRRINEIKKFEGTRNTEQRC